MKGKLFGGNEPVVVCYTLLIETSPQALPLGAACVASAIKNHPKTKDKFDVRLIADSMEDFGNGIPKEVQNDGLVVHNDRAVVVPNNVSLVISNLFRNFTKTPFAVCFSIFVWNRKQIEAMSREIKARYPDCVTICGGPEVTANPESFTSDFDYIVPGPGEESVPELLARLWSDLQSDKVASSGEPEQAVWVKSGKILPVIQPEENIISPYLDGTLDPAEYGGALWELARGCPFKCSYCFESKGSNKIQYFPMERIEAELDLFAKKKIPQVFVLDPTYNADKKRAIQILNLIQKKTLSTFYYFEARAEFIDRELARSFTKIPCALQIGLQSADENVLRLVHRTFNKKQFVKNINILNEEGVVFGFDLIYGLPGDTYKGFKRSLDFAISLYPNNLETFCLSVLPGTVLYDEAEKLHLTFESEPPYHVLHTDKYSKSDIEKSARLSAVCKFFYNQGRAVPWFNSVCRFFQEKPSDFLIKFINWYEKSYKNTGINIRLYEKLHKNSISNSSFEKNCDDFSVVDCESGFFEMQKLQLAFLKNKCDEKNQPKAYKAIENVVLLHGAFSENEATGKPQVVTLCYHPDDLLSEYATDISFFVKNTKVFKCRVKVEKGNYRVLKG